MLVGFPMRDEYGHHPIHAFSKYLRSGTPYVPRDALVLFNGTTADRNVLLPRPRVQWVHVFDSAWSQMIDDGGVTSA